MADPAPTRGQPDSPQHGHPDRGAQPLTAGRPQPSLAEPPRPAEARLLGLQQTAGNAAVAGLLEGNGRPIPAGLRAEMSARLGDDFSDVRVHTDEQAADSARTMGAKAYTIGHHIAFGPTSWQPSTAEGRQRLAHELVHVRQQRSAGASEATAKADRLLIPNPEHETEQEAEALASSVVAGPIAAAGQPDPPEPPSVRRMGELAIQRQHHGTEGSSRPGEGDLRGAVAPVRIGRLTAQGEPTVLGHYSADEAPEGFKRRMLGAYFAEYFPSMPQTVVDRHVRELLPRAYVPGGLRPGLVVLTVRDEDHARLMRDYGDLLGEQLAEQARSRLVEELEHRGALDIAEPSEATEQGPEREIPAADPRASRRTVGSEGSRGSEPQQGVRQDLQDIFIRRFQSEAEGITLDILDAAAALARAELERYTGSGGEDQRAALSEALQSHGGATETRPRREAQRRVGLQPNALSIASGMQELGARDRAAVAHVGAQFPIVAAASTAHAAQLARVGEPQLAVIQELVTQQLDSVAEIRSALGAEYSIWGNPRIIGLTKRRMGIAPSSNEAAWIRMHVIQRDINQASEAIFLASLGLAFSLLAAVSIPPIAFALGTAPNLLVGALSTLQSIRQYETAYAAAHTHFDINQALSQVDPSLTWLAVEIALFMLDVGDVARSGAELATTAQRIGRPVERVVDEASAGRRIPPHVRVGVLEEVRTAAGDEWTRLRDRGHVPSDTREAFVNQQLSACRNRLDAVITSERAPRGAQGEAGRLPASTTPAVRELPVIRVGEPRPPRQAPSPTAREAVETVPTTARPTQEPAGPPASAAAPAGAMPDRPPSRVGEQQPPRLQESELPVAQAFPLSEARPHGFPMVVVPDGPPTGGEAAMARFEQLARQGADQRELTRAALGEVAAFEGDVAAKAQLFNAMATRINQVDRNWIAVPTPGEDGSVVFVGAVVSDLESGYAAEISSVGVRSGPYNRNTFLISETEVRLRRTEGWRSVRGRAIEVPNQRPAPSVPEPTEAAGGELQAASRTRAVRPTGGGRPGGPPAVRELGPPQVIGPRARAEGMLPEAQDASFDDLLRAAEHDSELIWESREPLRASGEPAIGLHHHRWLATGRTGDAPPIYAVRHEDGERIYVNLNELRRDQVEEYYLTAAVGAERRRAASDGADVAPGSGHSGRVEARAEAASAAAPVAGSEAAGSSPVAGDRRIPPTRPGSAPPGRPAQDPPAAGPGGRGARESARGRAAVAVSESEIQELIEAAERSPNAFLEAGDDLTAGVIHENEWRLARGEPPLLDQAPAADTFRSPLFYRRGDQFRVDLGRLTRNDRERYLAALRRGIARQEPAE